MGVLHNSMFTHLLSSGGYTGQCPIDGRLLGSTIGQTFPIYTTMKVAVLSGVSIMQEAFLSILSKLDATQECTGYTA